MMHETADMVDSSLGLYVIMMSKTADYASYSLDSHHLNGTRAGRYISCDMHAHLVSKAGSLISSKSPSPVSGVQTRQE